MHDRTGGIDVDPGILPRLDIFVRSKENEDRRGHEANAKYPPRSRYADGKPVDTDETYDDIGRE